MKIVLMEKCFNDENCFNYHLTVKKILFESRLSQGKKEKKKNTPQRIPFGKVAVGTFSAELRENPPCPSPASVMARRGTASWCKDFISMLLKFRGFFGAVCLQKQT